MNTISLIKLLTLASFFVLAAGVHAVEVDENESKEACRIRVSKDRSGVESVCKTKKIITTNSAGEQLEKDPKQPQIDACVKTEMEALLASECGEKESQKDKNASCKQVLKEYDDAMKKTDEECDRMDVSSIRECREKARQCSKGLDSFSEEEPEGESDTSAIVRMIGIYGQRQGAAAGNSGLAGCVIENDDSAKKEEERIDDKITRLREEIQDLKEKATAADKELNEKKQDVEKEMLDVEKDAAAAAFAKQTKNQEDAGRMQKAIVASEKKRRDNLLKIADLNIDIANFSFAHQKLNLALSDARITKECRDKSIAKMNAKVKSVLDPKTGKESRPKFTLAQSLQFKKDLKMEEGNCLQEKALQRAETTKALVDQKRKVKVQIDVLTASNVDEEKAIASEIKQMEELKKIAAEEEKNAIEAKIKKLNSLNKSVSDMEKYIADKKKSYDEKSKAKEDQITKLLLDRQNVKPKFAKVTSTVSVSARAASVYLNQCCAYGNGSPKNHSECTRVTRVEPEGKTRKTIRSTK